MSRQITSTTAADGTELQLRERDDGLFEIRNSSGAIIEEPSATDERGAREALERTQSDINVGLEAEQSRQSRSPGFGGGFGSGRQSRSPDSDSGGGLFGGGMTERDSDSGGGLFGGGSRERDTTRRERDDSGGGGFFASFGGGSRSGRRERDADSGRFAPAQRDPVDFEMERDSRGRFSGRADDEQDGSSGFLGGLFR